MWHGRTLLFYLKFLCPFFPPELCIWSSLFSPYSSGSPQKKITLDLTFVLNLKVSLKDKWFFYNMQSSHLGTWKKIFYVYQNVLWLSKWKLCTFLAKCIVYFIIFVALLNWILLLSTFYLVSIGIGKLLVLK